MVRSIPEGASLMIRTDFSDDDAWESTVAVTSIPSTDSNGNFREAAHLTYVDDQDYDGMTVSELVDLVRSAPPPFVFLADTHTFLDDEHSILAVDTGSIAFGVDVPRLRVLPGEIAPIEANLSTGNVDFSSYVDAADADGVFRGLTTQKTLRKLSKAELIAVIGQNISTPALAQLHNELATMNIVLTSLVHADLRKDHDHVAAGDYSGTEQLIGRDEFLSATSHGGPAIALTIPLPAGYWSVVLHVRDLRPIAAIKVQMPAYNPSPRDKY